MIDTDKYEGHNMHPALLDVGDDYNNWDALQEMGFNDEARQLIADAPLLLAEVKRLRERLSMWEDWFKQGADNKMQDGDAYDIIFHNHDTCPSECSNHLDDKCWTCQTKELIE